MEIMNKDGEKSSGVSRVGQKLTCVIWWFMGTAEAAGLSKVTSTFANLETWLTTFVPIAATVALIFIAIGYFMRFVHKETFGVWAIGLIAAGSASEIVGMLM